MWDEDSRYDAAEDRNRQTKAGYGDYDSFDELGDSRMSSGDRGAAQGQHTYGGIRQMEQTSANSAREHSAINGQNPYATLHQINRELMEAGLPSPLLLVEQPECLEDNQRIVDCLVALLERHKRDAGFRESMGDELRKAMGEEDQLRSSIARLQRELDASQRDAAVTRIKLQEAERIGNETDMQRKQVTGELRAVRATAAQVRAQFQHEAKKREQEAGKLKDRMQKLITDKYRSAKISLELVNPMLKGLQPLDALGREQAAFKRLVDDYEAKQHKLVERVAMLEDLLRDVHGALAALRAEFGAADGVGGNAEAETEADDETALENGRAMALVASVRQAVYRERAEQRQQVARPSVDSSELERRDKLIAEQENEIARQQKSINDLSQLLAEQKRMLDAATQDTAGRRMSLDSSFDGLSGEQLEYERSELRREQQQLLAERQKFTEAAIELGNERSELKRKVEMFEKEKEEFYSRGEGRLGQSTEALMAGLPETPQWMRGLDATTLQTPALMRSMQAAETPTQQMLASMFMQGAGAMLQAAQRQTLAGGAMLNTDNIIDTPTRPEAAQPAVEENNDDDDGNMSDSFDEAAVTPVARRTATTTRASAANQQGRARTHGSSSTPNLYRSTGTLRPQSRAASGSTSTPVRPLGARTPVDIRTGRQPRTCTRPGCAAHAHHEHEDGTSAPRMELKPPVPRVARGRKEEDAGERPSGRLANGARHNPIGRPASR
ncbi:hypothetical protein GGI05_003058, partial [Coemansia sp. RSA 2603]